MINYQKNNFDESLEDIMNSVNKILNNTGEGFETCEDKKGCEENGKNKEEK